VMSRRNSIWKAWRGQQRNWNLFPVLIIQSEEELVRDKGGMEVVGRQVTDNLLTESCPKEPELHHEGPAGPCTLYNPLSRPVMGNKALLARTVHYQHNYCHICSKSTPSGGGLWQADKWSPF
jgi:hypothetical protein